MTHGMWQRQKLLITPNCYILKAKSEYRRSYVPQHRTSRWLSHGILAYYFIFLFNVALGSKSWVSDRQSSSQPPDSHSHQRECVLFKATQCTLLLDTHSTQPPDIHRSQPPVGKLLTAVWHTHSSQLQMPWINSLHHRLYIETFSAKLVKYVSSNIIHLFCQAFSTWNCSQLSL